MVYELMCTFFFSCHTHTLESTQDHKEETASNALIEMDDKKKVITTVTSINTQKTKPPSFLMRALLLHPLLSG